jgi:ABC-type cobalamin/Fe3+-siderophores transport system ATPase subunit
VIELLGIGAPGARGEWLFRRVSARLEPRELVFIVANPKAAGRELINAVVGRRLTTEGRVWVGGLPVTRETRREVLARVGEIDLGGPTDGRRSVLWNVLRSSRGLETWVRWRSATWRAHGRRVLEMVGLAGVARRPLGALDGWSRRRLLVARALLPCRRNVVLADVDDQLGLAESADVLGLLRTLARVESMMVLVSVSHPVLVHLFADRVLALHDGAPAFVGALGRWSGDTRRLERSSPPVSDEAWLRRVG